MSTPEPSTPILPNDAEIMMLAFHQDRTKWRPVIYVGPPDEPNNASQLYLGEWRNSLRKAQITGLKHYFVLYEQRYGFKHPEDPFRTKTDGPLPFNVMTLRDDREVQSYTCEEWPETVNIRERH